MQRYRAKLKTRAQMERDIAAVDRGWWFDVCPGRTMTVRAAAQSDIDRCILREGTTRDPAAYLCETTAQGSLVRRDAVERLTELEEVLEA